MSHHTETHFGGSISGLIGVALLVALIYGVVMFSFDSGEVVAPEQVVAARLAPIGSVNTDAAAVVAAAAPADSAAAGDPGEAVYNKACQACHATGAAGAPLLGNKEAWQARIDLGLDALLQTAITGKGAMPPRGTCADCSDDDLKAAIAFMVSKVQ